MAKSPKTPKSLKQLKTPKTATPPVGNTDVLKKKAKTPQISTPVSTKKSPKNVTPKGKGTAGKQSLENDIPVVTPKLSKKELKRLSNTAVEVSASPKSPKNKQKKDKKKKNKTLDTSSNKVEKNTNNASPEAAGKKKKVGKKQKESLEIVEAESPTADAEETVEKPTRDRKSVTYNTYSQAIKIQSNAAATALLQYAAKKKEESIFKDLTTRISMNVECFKTPTMDQAFFNILLPHSIHPEEADVVLIIKHDRPKDEDFQEDELKSSLFKQKLLAEHGIKIREVLTLKQLRNDYSTQEAKRAFIKRIDALLVDKSIIKHVPGILGREMYRRKKFCMAVNMADGHDIVDEIQKALKKTVLHVSTKGTSSNVVVGNDELTAEQLTENIAAVCDNLSKTFPGGWPNISKLSIEGLDLPPFSIYFSKGAPQEVTKPVKRSRRMRETVEDEISTQLNKRIKVHPDGAINMRTVSDDDED